MLIFITKHLGCAVLESRTFQSKCRYFTYILYEIAEKRSFNILCMLSVGADCLHSVLMLRRQISNEEYSNLIK